MRLSADVTALEFVDSSTLDALSVAPVATPQYLAPAATARNGQGLQTIYQDASLR